MKRIGLIVLLAVVSGDVSAQAGARRALVTRIDSMATTALAQWPAVGLSIAVVRGRDTITMKGYGRADLEQEVPATAQTVYRIGSITKQFTAVAILQLMEQGKLSLDDTIQRFLPDYHAQGHHITIRHLLTHTSGIKSYTGLGPEWERRMRLDLPHDSLVAMFEDKPFDFEPGARFLYNNSGYYLLGMIIERITGQAYGRYLEQHEFRPLGLKATLYCDDRPLVAHRAAGYERDSGGFVNASPLSMTQPYSAGALCSTVGDLVAWQRALVAHRLISAASGTMMATSATLNDGSQTRYGFGLAIATLGPHRKIGHGGGINGFLTALDYYPDDSLTVVVLANSESAKPGRLAEDIARLVLAVPPDAVKDLALGAAEVSRFTGTYALGPLQIRVFESAGKLQAQATGQGAFGLKWQGDSTFVSAFDDAVRLVFHSADGAPATTFILFQGGLAQTATRVP
ncbi:MAG TPA: serine hydrolase domain-containing protein [Gemmatimonadales bacterium]|nr:serine hydrolase domain-containing protein [Gemmatimonadales bacterium]